MHTTENLTNLDESLVLEEFVLVLDFPLLFLDELLLFIEEYVTELDFLSDSDILSSAFSSISATTSVTLL